MAGLEASQFQGEPMRTRDIDITADFAQAMAEEFRFMENQPIMVHRGSNLAHSDRTAETGVHMSYLALSPGVALELEGNIRFFGKVHDGPEIVSTDWPSHHKHGMNPEDRKELDRVENIAIRTIGESYLNLEGDKLARFIHYMGIYQRKETIETWFVDMADKFDGLGEVLHELRCGNEAFIEPYRYYRDIKIPSMKEKYFLWDDVLGNPIFGIKDLPSDDEALNMPRLTVDDLKSRQTIREDVDDPKLPRAYRTWLGMALKTFLPQPQPELYLFPGWKTELRRRWNYDRRIMT